MREYPNLKDLTYTDSSGKHQYQLQAHQLRELMGLKPGKLPKHEGTITYLIGDTCVILIPHSIAKKISPKATRPHRVYAVCNSCGSEIPAGKLQQHIGSKECAKRGRQ